MTTDIFLRFRYTILGEIVFGPNVHKLQFTVSIEGYSPVNVEVISGDKEVLSLHHRDISTALWEFLQKDYPEVPLALHSEISSISSDVTSAARKVLNLVKYGLGCINLDELLLSRKTAEWSVNNVDWKPWPTPITGTIRVYGTHPLDESTASAIQQCIDRDFKPFVALRHLHKARMERIPHYKWIDATIAAELAIKEFLIRFRPEIATLLLEMPSPPLHKLYGPILESFGLQRSPKVKEIAKGVEIRNKLVHRPEETKITLNEASSYVQDVESAIFHLMFLLYPNDPNVKYFYYASRFEEKST